MTPIIQLLIVDDHSMIIEGYKSILSNFSAAQLNIASANDCEKAYALLTPPQVPYDVIMLDMNLPAFESAKLFSGEDLARLIRKNHPAIKIIIVTSSTEAFVLYNLVKTINPEGVLVKSDATPAEFQLAFQTVLNGEHYMSMTARQAIKNIQQENSYLDAYNRKIISLLAKGIATKSLPAHLNITISAIDKRKAAIKEFFDIEKGNDEDIIREAKKRGFV